MGAFGTNDVEVGGIACEFLVAGHTKTGNAEKGWVLEAGDRRRITTRIGDTVASEIWGQATGGSVGVGCPTDYF